ncbi:class I SAM-dependent methyltransferase [Microlunatus soli]|uniref:class I SAM-dependent methyltransferase n=1 Tax=Microlunatus soli TaxID=630515 RepID=UPI001E445C88|nr:class I SAM-dependent methyltransferase [Microlunatus soli]
MHERSHGTGAAEDHAFDKAYWERHWRQPHGESAPAGQPPNPYLIDEVADLTPGTALDAGCGAGAEAIWLASAGWRVTAADISTEALARAAARAPADDAGPLDWIRADLGVWEPEHPFDLVTTHYAHPAMPQLDFYERIARWVAPGGTLLIVGHLHGRHSGHGEQPPSEASATPATVTALFAEPQWGVVTAAEHSRTVVGRPTPLQDFVVRVTRLN